MGINKQKLIENNADSKKKPKLKPYKTEKEEIKTVFKVKLERRKSKKKKYVAEGTIEEDGTILRTGKKIPNKRIPESVKKKRLKRAVKIDSNTDAFVFQNVTRIETDKLKETQKGDRWQVVADVKVKKGTRIIKRRFGNQWRFHSDKITKRKVVNEMKKLLAKIESVYEPLGVRFRINYYRSNDQF